MGVSLTGTRGLSLASIRYFAIVMAVTCGLLFYLYGPLVTPFVHGRAVSGCNELIGGNFRSYRLEWVVSTRPHWECWDRGDPAAGPVDMGWWVSSR